MNNLIEDVAALSTIPPRYLNKLLDKVYYSINDEISEAIIENKDTVDIDIGIGTLKILLNPNSLKYKFIPSAKLEASTKATVQDKKNSLVDKLETYLVDKIIHTYKDII